MESEFHGVLAFGVVILSISTKVNYIYLSIGIQVDYYFIFNLIERF